MTRSQIKQKKLAVLRIVEENKEILFGSFQNNAGKKKQKEEAWLGVLKKAQSLGLTSGNRQWNYARDHLFGLWKSRTLAKRENFKKKATNGGRAVILDEVDKKILQIVGKDSSIVGYINIPKTNITTFHQIEQKELEPFASQSHYSLNQQQHGTEKSTSDSLDALKKEVLESELYINKLNIFKLEKEIGLHPSKFTLEFQNYLPDVVEKVIDSLKESELKNIPSLFESVESSNISELKENTSAVNKSDVKLFEGTNNKVSTQSVTQGILMDSLSTSSKQSDLEHLEEINKSKNKSSPIISSDIDSLRTSSPESEIEQALANNNDQNPPTPKPTFSELQNLVVGPVNTMIKSHIKATETFISQAVEKNPAIDNADKSEDNSTSTNRKDPTEWEKQADMMALTQKFNPLEAMRKFRRDNGGERNGNGLILRNEIKPKIQNIFEDLNEFLPMQSPLRSRLSSAKSEKSLRVISSESGDIGQCYQNDIEDNQKHKGKEFKLKKSPARKIKDSYLIVPTNNVRGVPSPSPHKVRERCAVCCNKYKH